MGHTSTNLSSSQPHSQDKDDHKEIPISDYKASVLYCCGREDLTYSKLSIDFIQGILCHKEKSSIQIISYIVRSKRGGGQGGERESDLPVRDVGPIINPAHVLNLRS